MSLVLKAVTRRGTSILIAALCSLALLVPAASTSAQTSIVSYATTGRLKVAKRIQYNIVCSVQCQVTASSTLKLKGPDLPPAVVPGTLAAGAVASPFIVLNRPALHALKSDPGKARLVSSITATDTATGASQTISRTFKFKR
jgi:hypothetical protein